MDTITHPSPRQQHAKQHRSHSTEPRLRHLQANLGKAVEGCEKLYGQKRMELSNKFFNLLRIAYLKRFSDSSRIKRACPRLGTGSILLIIERAQLLLKTYSSDNPVNSHSTSFVAKLVNRVETAKLMVCTLIKLSKLLCYIGIIPLRLEIQKIICWTQL